LVDSDSIIGVFGVILDFPLAIKVFPFVSDTLVACHAADWDDHGCEFPLYLYQRFYPWSNSAFI
jgi:hypothetical protein